ncbi:hypothetical protein [Microvirga guangxiensis]|uniref:Uncharacterized protein n=1 Tax=Microvirga guangxiensis TaxID=549386 RepID=A0A1G5KMJ9_9HYPH|nr:hypothetical protein [Microvirga guangxiensis]SCZ01318.1 hypothetical protein SAMN02927923_03426 [Microvirga guangxiensis]
MSTVHGQVVCKESGLGVKGLVVAALDVPGPELTTTVTVLSKTRRLASGFTGADGTFLLAFDKTEGESEPINLLVIVSGPEVADQETAPLFVSPKVRPRAANHESYLIQIPEEQLRKSGITSPGIREEDAKPVEVTKRRIIGAAEDNVQISEAETKARGLKIERAASIAKQFNDDFLPKIAERLSRVTGTRAASDTFVRDGASVEGASATVMANDLGSTINDGGDRAPVKVRFALTEAQHDAVAAELSGGKISREALRIVLGKSMLTSELEYTAESPLAVLTRDFSPKERSAAEALGIKIQPPPAETQQPTVPGTTDVLGPNAEALEEGDIDKFLGRLTVNMTSPEEAVLAGLEPKATQGDLSSRMQGLEFRPSPAEDCALYDFSHLQIAFRHVWQEAIDEGVLSLAETAYDQIVKAGGAPSPTTHRDPIRALTKAGEIVFRASASDASSSVPTVLAKAAGNAPPTPPVGRRPFPPVWAGPIDGVFEGTKNPTGEPSDELPDIINELNQRLKEPYSFTTFAANRQERSINFGCLVTYRQRWCPVVYQAGRIAKTLTLAPKEVQRYTKTIRRKTRRAEKEVKNHLVIRKDEMAQTSRLEQDIVSKAQTKTHFEMSAEQSTPGGTGPTSKMSFGREASQNSDQAKKSFRESVIKAAQEFKDEYNVEVTTEESDEYETVETGELSNPNDELAVTFIFYELQRRYRISERLHRLTPVVFVALEMPAPHEINESWIMSHDWILRRVLLDDSFVPALDYLCSRIVGDQVAIEELKTNIIQQRQILAELKQQLKIVRERTASYRSMLEKSMLVTAARRAEGGGGGGGLFGSIVRSIPGIGSAIELSEDAMEAVGDFLNPDQPNVGDNRLDTLKETIQRSIEEERDMLMRVEREVTALNALTESYARLLADNKNQRAMVLRLRIHLKQNITYYMQQIWSHQPPDQMFLELHETPVPRFKDESQYNFGAFEPVEDAMNPYVHRNAGPNEPTKIYEATVISKFSLAGTEPLGKVAHLNEAKGYFGNYAMYALRESNPLTEFMMEPYVLRGFEELTDPDDVGNWTLDEFAEYVVRLKEGLTTLEFNKIKDQLGRQYARLLKSPLRDGEEIIVPTGSLYIEALPASTSLHEGLKRLQRSMEVKLTQENVRSAALRNLLLAHRILNDELDDPDIDKKVVITGIAAGPTVPIDDPN